VHRDERNGEARGYPIATRPNRRQAPDPAVTKANDIFLRHSLVSLGGLIRSDALGVALGSQHLTREVGPWGAVENVFFVQVLYRFLYIVVGVLGFLQKCDRVARGLRSSGIGPSLESPWGESTPPQEV